MYSWTAVLPPSHRSIHRICNMAPMCTPFLETALKRHHPRAQHTRTRRRTVKYNRPYLCCTCDAAYNLHTEWSTLAVVLLVAMSTEFCWCRCRCRYLFRSVPSVFVMGNLTPYDAIMSPVIAACVIVYWSCQCVVILWVMLSVWMNQQLVISSDVSSIWSSLHVLNYASTCALQQPCTAGTQSSCRLPKI